MENNLSVGVKSSQSDLSILDATETSENLKENSDSEYEENKPRKYIVSIDNAFNFVTPSELLVKKIIQKVEFLFSDSNIAKDKFLLKHLRRDKEGYVSLKLISSLRKVKAVSRDWRTIVYSLRKSEKLQMNEDMTKIKRIVPFSETGILAESRTVLVFHYMTAYWTVENMKKKLRSLGRVVSLEMVKSEADVMDDNVKKTLDLHKEIATFPFAVVRFENGYESAKAISQTSNSASPFKMVPLVGDGNGDHSEATASPPSCTLNENGEQQFPYACKGDGPDTSGWIRRKSRIVREKLENQKPFVVVLRQPKGPDGTEGFRKSKLSNNKSPPCI